MVSAFASFKVNVNIGGKVTDHYRLIRGATIAVPTRLIDLWPQGIDYNNLSLHICIPLLALSHGDHVWGQV